MQRGRGSGAGGGDCWMRLNFYCMIKASDRSRTGELRRIAAQQLEEERERGERRGGKEGRGRGLVCKHCKHCKIFARRFLLNHWKSLLIPRLTLHMAHTAGQWHKGSVDSGGTADSGR